MSKSSRPNALLTAVLAFALSSLGLSALAQDRPYASVIDASQFEPSVLLNQNWKEKPRNMSVIDVPGIAGSIIVLRNGLGSSDAPQPEWQYDTSNLPQESYKTELLDEVLFDRMINVSNTTGLSATHPIFSFGIDFADTDMVRLTVKRAFRKTAPSLSDDGAYAALKEMAERNFNGDPNETFYWVKAVELRTVTLQTFKEVKRAGNAGLFFFSAKKSYQFTDKTIGTREYIGIDVLTKTLAQVRAQEKSQGDQTRDIETSAFDDAVTALFAADIPFSKLER